MDPTSTTASNGKYWWELQYDFLVGLDAQGQLSKATGLADNWTSQHPADGTGVYTFDIRSGATFQDGAPVTVNDAAFSLKAFLSARSKTANANLLRGVIKSITTSGNKLVVVTNHPYDLLPFDLSRGGEQEGMVLPADYIKHHGWQYFASHPVGSGPYQMTSQRLNSDMIFTAEPHNWYWGTPKYHQVEFFLSADATSRLAGLQTGRYDIADLTSAQIPQIKSDTSKGLSLVQQEDTTLIDVHLHNTFNHNTFLANEQVREALNLAIDRKTILAKIFGGLGEVSGSGTYGPDALGYQAIPPYSYDPTKAKQLLTQAYPKGVSLTLYEYTRPGADELPSVDQAVANMWEAVGVHVTQRPIDAATFITQWLAGKVDNAAAAHNHDDRATLESVFPVIFEGNSQLTLTKDPMIDSLINKMLAAPLSTLGAAQHAVALYIHDHYYDVPIVVTGQGFGVRTSVVPQWTPGRVLYSYGLLQLTHS